MDGDGKKPRGGPNAARPAPTTTDATQQQPAALETPALSNDDAVQQVYVGQPDMASADESRGADEEDNHDVVDDDDEQVERFYALLANIRAMRGLPLHKHDMVFSSSSCGGAGAGGDTDSNTAGDSTRTRKRLRRSAEPQWRPVFRMEDFEESPPPPASSSTCKMTNKRTRGAGHDDDGETSGGSERPTVAVVASSMTHAAVRFQQSESSS